MGLNISFNKLVANQSGMLVGDFVIIEGKTVPSYVETQSVNLDLSITARRIFSTYKISGNLNINGITYYLASSDYGSGEYIVSLTSSNINEIAGMLKISDDLEFYSIKLTGSNNYLAGPAKTEEEVNKIIHNLYGDFGD